MKKRATKRPTKRPIKQEQIIVLIDGAGNYYEIKRAALERSRVSEGRKEKVAAALENVEVRYKYIQDTAIPGSIAAPKSVGALELHYAGFYVRSTRAKR